MLKFEICKLFPNFLTRVLFSPILPRNVAPIPSSSSALNLILIIMYDNYVISILLTSLSHSWFLLGSHSRSDSCSILLFFLIHIVMYFISLCYFLRLFLSLRFLLSIMLILFLILTNAIAVIVDILRKNSLHIGS